MSNRAKGASCVLAAFGLALLTSGTANAADNWLGTWKVNLAKSKYSPGPAPKSNTSKIEAWEGGMKITTDGVGGDDKPTHTEIAVKYDGKDYPYKGSPNADMISVKRIDDDSYESTTKLKGKAMLVNKNVISKDGKARTQTQTGTDAQGRTVSNTVVWDRQ